MSTKIQTREFARLFKLYRLHSGIGTLKEFSELMEKENLNYDVSVYTRWQQGKRIPNERRIILGMIKIFLKKDTITRIEDINSFMNIAGQKDLDEDEIDNLLHIIHQQRNVVPPSVPDFVGRRELLKDINWHLLSYEIIFIYGPPGTGKTSVVVQMAHLLEDHIKDGIFYYRVDIQYADTILVDIAKSFGEDISQVGRIEDKIIFIREIFRKKQILLILDNVENYKNVSTLLIGLKSFCKFIVVSQHKPLAYEKAYNIHLPSFSEEEVLQLAGNKMGGDYVEKNKHAINELANLTARSPLALSILFSYIFTQKVSIDDVVDRIDNWLLPLTYQTTYDNKTMASSLDLLINTLSKTSKDILSSFSMFDGKDISTESLMAIHALSYDECVRILNDLVNLSLLDRGKKSRFQIHPLIKSYISQQLVPSKWYTRLANYFVKIDSVEEDIDNIKGVFRYCKKHKSYQSMIKIWNHIAVYLFANGRWEDIKEYKDSLISFSTEDKLKKYMLYIMFIFFICFGVIELFHDNLASFFSYSYGTIAMYGGLMGLLIAKKWKFSSSYIGRAITMFSLGLLAQEFGQLAYTLIGSSSSQYPTPYPSIGDIGYFGSIPLYILGLIFLSKAAGLKYRLKSITNSIFIILVPLLTLVTSYFIFLKGYEFIWTKPLTIFLDFAYPLGQAIYISLAIMIFLLSRKTLGGVLRNGLMLVLLALILQYIADFIFLYQFSRHIWTLGNISDFLYLPAYGTMSIALLQFDYTYKLKDPKNPDLFTKVKNYLLSR